MEEDGPPGTDDERRQISEVALGITVLGVIVNMGLTLAFGIHAALGWRLGAAFGIPLLFIVGIAVGSRKLGFASKVSRAISSYGDDPWAH